MPPINTLIKPASSSCNLRCAYCFYHDVADNRNQLNYGLMSEATLRTIVQKTLAPTAMLVSPFRAESRPWPDLIFISGFWFLKNNIIRKRIL